MMFRILAIGILLCEVSGAENYGLDTSFGDNGISISEIPGSKLSIHSGGKIKLAGSVKNTSSSNRYDFSLASYLKNGTLDVNFGTGGVVETDIDAGADFVGSVVALVDGTTLVAGYAERNSATTLTYDFTLVKYTSSGRLDTSFGDSTTPGITITPVGNSISEAYGMTMEGEKILLTGLARNANNKNEVALVRYLPTGYLDLSFFGGGIVTTPVGGTDGSRGYASDIAIQNTSEDTASPHKILLGGAGRYNNGQRFSFLLRYDKDGHLDTSFGIGGELTVAGLDFKQLLVQTDSKILAIGPSYDNSRYLMLRRYNKNGSIDTSFGESGTIMVLDASMAAFQNNGNIVIAGSINSMSITLRRYDKYGKQDLQFGNNGIVVTSIEGSDGNRNNPSDITVQADNKILVSGSTTINGNAKRILIRYLEDAPYHPVNSSLPLPAIYYLLF